MGVLVSASVLGVFSASSSARANTVSGFAAFGTQSEMACMDRWDSLVMNSCSGNTVINAHFDLGMATASPDHYYAHVWGQGGGFGGVDFIQCWGESWSYDNNSRYLGSTVSVGTATGYYSLDLGNVGTLNTHNVVCSMHPGSYVFAVDG
jgi:hypothetical protein